MSKSPVDFFNAEMAKSYDERNKKLSHISANLHFLMGLVLNELPANAKILCVGAGTGAEILSLSEAFPQWTFVALDPSLPMLNTCRERLEKAGIADRCEFIHGYVQDAPSQSQFDAVLSILVSHFINLDQRQEYFNQMSARLKKGGYLINAEISFDLSSEEFPLMIKNWSEIQKLMGATPESLANLPTVLKENLAVLPPKKTEEFFRLSGVKNPVQFFQAFMIHAWYGIK